MSDVQESLASVLRRASERLREAGSPAQVSGRIEALAGQVHEPCVVAVVGRVKVGKSTFVNALLGEDLAKVGTIETTATINYFAYGQPDPDRPVRCHWRGGRVTDESRAFLDGLQGNDLETLRRADGVDHLEYFLPNPVPKQITLVDTPGTGAVVDEHEDRTAEFMRLNERLRERHDEETRRLGDTADAVIYLVGQVAKASDGAFLQKFARTTRGRSSALNAIGVLSKIELQPEVLARRHELSAKISAQLGESLNAVIPVAAGVRRELDGLLKDGALERLASTLRRIPPDVLEMLLDAEEFFRDFDFPDCLVPPAERAALLGEMKWAVFATVARVAADPSLDLEGVARRLQEMAGFGPLWEVLERHFIQRGHILRCYYRIAYDAQQVLNGLRYTYLRASGGRRAGTGTAWRGSSTLYAALARRTPRPPATSKSSFVTVWTWGGGWTIWRRCTRSWRRSWASCLTGCWSTTTTSRSCRSSNAKKAGASRTPSWPSCGP